MDGWLFGRMSQNEMIRSYIKIQVKQGEEEEDERGWNNITLTNRGQLACRERTEKTIKIPPALKLFPMEKNSFRKFF